MKIALWLATVACAAILSASANAQTPAGAPAGSNGLCKDGTYSTAASKAGACRGHGGVQTWFGPTTEKAKPASAAKTPAPAASTPTAAAPGNGPATGTKPTSASAQAAKPTPAPVPATKPAPAVAAKPASTPAPVPAPATRPAPQAQAAPTQPAPAAKTARTPTSQMQAAPGGGAGTVWVNTESKVYHCAGSRYYGKTKAGKYLSEEAAKAEGDRPNDNRPCSK